MNLQVIASPSGDILWVSGALPGAVHDKKAEWIWGVLAELEAAGLLTDWGTWRDLLWLIVDPLAGWFMTLAPAALILWGLFGIVMPAVWRPIVDAGGNNWYAFIHVDGAAPAWLCVPLGAGAVALGTWAAPWLLGRYGRFAHALLPRPGRPGLRFERVGWRRHALRR